MEIRAISIVGQKAAKTLSKGKFWASKALPDGLVVAGIAGFGLTCVLVAKGTVVAEEVKKDAAIEKCCRMENEDKTDIIIKEAKGVVKAYIPAAVVGTITIGCFTGGHYILKKRNVALVAAYAAVDESFKNYRHNVVEKYGEEEDYRLKNNIHVEKESITEIGEDGKKHKKKIDVDCIDSEPCGYTFIYDKDHILYGDCVDFEYTTVMLRDKLVSAEKFANGILNSRGYITLNEVLEGLGLQPTTAGQIVGWQMDGNGDGFVDFRKREIRTNKDGGGPAFLLDFNVDGPIYQDIDKYNKRW